jgi:hypothetical protein
LKIRPTRGIAEVTMLPATLLSRRQVLRRIGGGFGALGLASVFRDAGLLASEQALPAAVNPLAPRPPHFPAPPSASSSCS